MNDQNKNGKSTVTGLPKITFSSFVLSLSSSALFHFGEIPDPVTNKKQKNIELAKQTIDILELLEKKTVNNLEKDEAVLLENLLYDLRMRYVNETKNIDKVKED
jgi:PBP1b-binding outer membrane lipoprotein LpoB